MVLPSTKAFVRFSSLHRDVQIHLSRIFCGPYIFLVHLTVGLSFCGLIGMALEIADITWKKSNMSQQVRKPKCYSTEVSCRSFVQNWQDYAMGTRLGAIKNALHAIDHDPADGSAHPPGRRPAAVPAKRGRGRPSKTPVPPSPSPPRRSSRRCLNNRI